MRAYYDLYGTISSDYNLKVVKLEVLNSTNQVISVANKAVDYNRKNVKSCNIRTDFDYVPPVTNIVITSIFSCKISGFQLIENFQYLHTYFFFHNI